MIYEFIIKQLNPDSGNCQQQIIAKQTEKYPNDWEMKSCIWQYK